jgi:DNA-binding response OmpR family regulator
METQELRIGNERYPVREESRQGRWSYRMKLGRETIWLDTIEFRILAFLAATPYRAYTRRRIAEAVGTDRFPVLEDSLDSHIASLRDKLGFFCDYVQAVPYVGYRFKA